MNKTYTKQLYWRYRELTHTCFITQPTRELRYSSLVVLLCIFSMTVHCQVQVIHIVKGQFS